MSKVQQAMALLIDVFDTHASKDGDGDTLNKNELKELLRAEFGGCLSKSSDKASIDSFFDALDADKSGSVDFKEFLCLVGALTQMCREHFVGKK